MEAEAATFFRTLVWAMAGGIVLFFLRVILVITLRRRVSSDHAPALSDISAPDSMSRLVALLGLRARPDETLGTLRLRPTLGLRLVYWVLAALMAVTLNAMNVPLLGGGTLLLLFVLVLALQTSLYEISFDQTTVTLPRWWFGRTTHRWADLLAIGTRDKWYMSLTFHRGPTVWVHKYIVGYDRFMETARKALRES